MLAAEPQIPFSDGDLARLFRAFSDHSGIVLAVSGGPDSTALMMLARAWRYGLEAGPSFLVATVDHGLRPDSRLEALQVEALCAHLGLPHVILPWLGDKPATGIQEAARIARHGLLAELAHRRGATAIAFGHTLDDQAETVLFRLARGSGLSGLCAMQEVSRQNDLALLRPFLATPKARLMAAVETAGLPFARDPSNLDAQFARPRLRKIAPLLAEEGLDAPRLALLAQRLTRADAALNAATDAAVVEVSLGPWQPDLVRLSGPQLLDLPEEISLRLVLRALTACASEGPVELAKAEALHGALLGALRGGRTLGRTLAGAFVALGKNEVKITPAPARTAKSQRRPSKLAANSL